MEDFKPIFIARRIENRILIGLACVTATIILIGWIAINENARMEEFTQRAHARSVEQGAKIFENNCSSCHGTDGLGLTGVAPALNSPQLFGYNFFASIDTEILLTNSQLDSSANPEERDALRARVAELEAERLALEETILYDWSDRLASIDERLAALDEQVLSLEGVTSASRLPVYISQIEANELAPLLAERDDLMAKVEEAAAAAAEETETEAAGEGVPGLTDAEAVRLAELETAINALEEGLAPYKNLKDQRDALVAERTAFQTLADAHATVQATRAELAAVEAQLLPLGEAPAEGEEDPNAEQRLELNNQAATLRSDLETLDIDRQAAYDALVEAAYILDYDPNGPSRLAEVAWAGSLYDFLEGTLTGGRPTSGAYWPQPMAAWSQLAGGPLRGDQIANLTNYILGWDREFTIEDARAVRQLPRIPGLGGGSTEGALGTDNVALIQQDIAAKLESGEITEGDVAAGQSVFTSLGCGGCHGQNPGTGPALTGMWARTENDEEGRLTNTGYTDNHDGYIIQSIVNPGAYIVNGFADGVMPQTFKDQLTYQDMVNILAYIQTQ